MTLRSTLTRGALAFGFGVATLAAAPAALAADRAASSADARYQKERAACDSGLSNQDRATCLREAGAAKVEAKRGGLPAAGSPATREMNATDRCNALPAKDRPDCLARIDGPANANQRTRTTGSVAGGGILRETTTVIPAPAASGAR